MNIAEVFLEQAGRRPNDVAIVDYRRGERRQMSFRELNEATARTAALFARAGLRAGDAVLIFQPMSAELYVTLIAIFRLGLVAMFLDPSAGRRHIERCCAMHPPRAWVATPRAHWLRLVSAPLRRIPIKYSTGMALPGAAALTTAARLPPLTLVAPGGQEAPALLTFTSGSTGAPKAALRTHGFLLAQHRVLEKRLDLVAGEVDLATLPIFVLANLGAGVTTVIPAVDLRRPGDIDAGALMAQIERDIPTRSAASPALFARLAAHEHEYRPGASALARLKKIYTGGAPVFPPLLESLQRLAPRADVAAVYGSTEAEPIAHISWRDIAGKDIVAMRNGAGLLVGQPVPEIALRIMRDSWGVPVGPFTEATFAAHCLPADVPGEIVVSGEHVLPGYLHGVGDSETKFSVAERRWHRTGDAGYFDGVGRLWLLGRCQARIVDEHGTVFPFSVETALSFYPTVRRSALVAVRGLRVLVVEPTSADVVDLEAIARELSWARLDAVRRINRIPMDKRHNAKVDYPALLALLERSGWMSKAVDIKPD